MGLAKFQVVPCGTHDWIAKDGWDSHLGGVG